MSASPVPFQFSIFSLQFSVKIQRRLSSREAALIVYLAVFHAAAASAFGAWLRCVTNRVNRMIAATQQMKSAMGVAHTMP